MYLSIFKSFVYFPV